MAPADDEGVVAADIAGVKIVDAKDETTRSTVTTSRNFQPGEVVFVEKAFVVALAYTNLARVRAYCVLPDADKRTLREQYFNDDPGVRCAATAACRPDSAGKGDSSADVLAALQAEGFCDLNLPEVESVIRAWNLNAYDRALGSIASSIPHSCAPNVEVSVSSDAGTITASACRAIAEGESLGAWAFSDTGLWWMGADLRRAMFETERGFQCACVRCTAEDSCRALPCGACEKGFEVPEGVDASGPQAAPAWRCHSCGHRGPGDTVRLKAESELAPEVLFALRPPRNTAPDAMNSLTIITSDTRDRLGSRHWVPAAASMIKHFRGRRANAVDGGKVTAYDLAHGCRFLGWLIDQDLPRPPASIVRTPVSLAIDCATALSAADSVDHRCIAARILNDYLLPIFDASGSSVAKIANTGAKVETLRTWLLEMRTTCGRSGCGKRLASGTAKSADATAGVPALACGRCKQVRYCSKECQQTDWKERHKFGCLSASESIAGDTACSMLLKDAA